MKRIQGIFSVQGHILSIGGDALRDGKYQTNNLIINKGSCVLSANKKQSLEQTQNGWSQDALPRTLFYTPLFA